MKKLALAVMALVLGTPALASDAAVPARVDLNTATQEQLTSGLGIDDAEARRIIEARPFLRKEDLKDKGVMTADEFEKLKQLIESIC